MKLNLPAYEFNYKTMEGKRYILDQFRKKYVRLTPEEWVRQNFIQYLVNEKVYPKSLLQVEMSFKVNQLQRRCDVAFFNNKGEPLLLVECKAPDVRINQEVFDQIVQYNMKFKVQYLVVTNGMDHYCCNIDYKKNTYNFLEEIPAYKDIK